jgi:hypothetical protein
MSNLYYLRDKELPAHLAAKLAPFIRAYAPHETPPTPKYLESLGYERKIEEVGFHEECKESYFERNGYYPEENPALLLASES